MSFSGNIDRKVPLRKECIIFSEYLTSCMKKLTTFEDIKQHGHPYGED